MSGKPIEIGILFFPGMTQLDVTGPFEVFARLPNVRVHLLWKRIEPVISDVGLPLLPTTIFADCPDLDVFCIGGGELYRAALPSATTLHMTEIARAFEGDAWFPPIDRGQWRETAREDRPATEPGGFAYSYITYERNGKGVSSS